MFLTSKMKFSNRISQLGKYARQLVSVDCTWKNYNVSRHERFSKLSGKDIDFFEKLLPSRVVTDEQDLEFNNVDWLRNVRGMSTLMLKPKSTEEISEVMKYCNERTLAVCPQGGNTGFVGGSVPVFDEIILSTSLMNKIYNIDATAGTTTCQAGVVLEQLDNALADHGLMVPLDLGAKGSCQIGGNVSTNAGGLKYFRYGSLHKNVLGLKVVLANGTVLDGLSTLKKDNTGYDLKQLFIGSEGTLGIVTAVSLMTPPLPQSVNLSFLGIKCYDDVKKVFCKAKGKLSEIMSAFEFMDNASLKSIAETTSLKNPISDHPFYILIETSGSNGSHDEEKLNDFLVDVMDSGIVSDGILATEPSKIKEVWSIRERLADALLCYGHLYTYDISLPTDVMYDIVTIMRERFEDKTTFISGFGHFGDGNLHLNLCTEKYDRDFLETIEPMIFSYVRDHKGSISAEHGLGFKKSKEIYYSRTPQAVEVMRKLKKLFDPKGILNPYKVLPESY